MHAGFKKDQIRILIDNYGKLRVSGERPVGENKWIRFRKDFQTPEKCNTTDIRAKFENGHVYITLPKVVVDQVPPPQAQATQAATQDKKATEPKIPSADQNGHSEKANGAKKEEKRSEPPPVDAENKVEEKAADQSDKDSKSTSDTDSDAESTEKPQRGSADLQKVSMRLRAFKQKAYDSRKTICSAFAVLVISVGVGLIISNKLYEFLGQSTDLVPIITP